MPPDLAVIVPVHNCAGLLDGCLRALRGAIKSYENHGGGAEIIVVDDASTDESDKVAEKHGAGVVKLEPPPSGPSVARNRGAGRANSEILVFVDADVVVKENTLTEIGDFFEKRPDIHTVFGSYDDTPGDPGFLSQYKNLFHHYVHQTSQENSSSFWAGCGAIRRAVFYDTGGFPEKYARPAIEDIELGYILLSKGYRSHLLKDLQVKHMKKWSFLQLLKTDIFMRGIPWTKLLLSTRSFTRDLNLQTHNRISVVLVYLILLCILGSLKWPWLIASVLPLGGLFIFLNIGLYQFFAEKKGFGFAIASIPLHVLYYFYNGISFLLGAAAHHINGKKEAPES